MNNPAALALALKIIKEFEGCELKAYKDIVGVVTIGYGETKGVKMGDVWTQEKADAEVSKRAQEFMDGIFKSCPRLLLSEPQQIAACVSLAYNIGLSAFANSTVCKRLMAGDYAGAAEAILMWNKAGGKVVNGLVRRREAEKKLFLSKQ